MPPALTDFDGFMSGFPSVVNTGPNDDDDGDGFTNFFEFAFNMDPSIKDDPGAKAPSVTARDYGTSYTVVYRRIANSNLNWNYYVSPDPAMFTTLALQPTDFVETVTPAGNEEIVTLTIVTTLAPRMFFRAEASE